MFFLSFDCGPGQAGKVDFSADTCYAQTSMRGKKDELKVSQIKTTLLAFMEAYNKCIPASFPRASVKALKQFQAVHSILFKNGDEWSIDKHRKKLMDWLPSHNDIA